MNTINNKDLARKVAIKAMLNSNHGKFFTVTALRKSPKKMADGTVEHFMTLTGRQGVKKYLAGGESTLNRNDDDMISLYVTDKEREGYRCFSSYNVLSISAGGFVLTFDRDDVMAMKGKKV